MKEGYDAVVDTGVHTVTTDGLARCHLEHP
jgi:hypothetical protein